MSRSKPVNDRDQVQKILSTLHQHSDIVSMSMVGQVSSSDANAATDKGIIALANVGALLPVGEGVFQLNPRIRRFLSDRLTQFSAMQSLTRITEQLHSAQAQWSALIEMRTSGDVADKAEIEESLGITVGEILYFVQQNLRLLNHQTTADFGNVESMRRKIRQNRFYAGNIKVLIAELDSLGAFLDKVDREGVQYGLYNMRNLLVGQIRPQMGEWRHRLNEIQAKISEKLFVRRQIDADLRLLLDAALWMESNPTLNGMEVELGQHPSATLLTPTRIAVQPHYDVSPMGGSQERLMTSVASKLPPPRAKPTAKEQKSRHVVIATTAEMEDEELAPADILVQELVHSMRSGQGKAFELLQWERERRLGAGIGDEEWLFYASNQLAIAGVYTELQIAPTTTDTVNAVFDGVMAFPN